MGYTPVTVMIVQPKPYTVCHLLDDDGQIFATGITKCNPTDTWHEEKGIKLAIIRAAKDLFCKRDAELSGVKLDRGPFAKHERLIESCLKQAGIIRIKDKTCPARPVLTKEDREFLTKSIEELLTELY